ncbi:MAG TPA: shikimate dehydrogenase [Terriglobales bacterium]|nr:shikimate dehydrogenase [Terriglobales bacterium]
MASNEPSISGHTAVYGLIGDPIEHSMSPTIQNSAFHSAGIDAIYVAWRVPSSGLESAVVGLRALGVKGFNVTTPHKTAVTRHLNHLDHFASLIHSVNTVKSEHGRLTGYNTDGAGVFDSLEAAGADPVGKSILLIGAGGAGRAAAFVLAERGCRLALMNRTMAKARSLANQLRKEFDANVSVAQFSTRTLHRLLDEAQIIINASSMGMHGKSNVPIKPTWIRSHHCVFELVYLPLETRLLQYATMVGAKTVTGLDMLLHQGAYSFTLWTGRKAPLVEMRQAIAGRLSSIGSLAR